MVWILGINKITLSELLSPELHGDVLELLCRASHFKSSTYLGQKVKITIGLNL